MSTPTDPSEGKPDHVTELERIYGAPSNSGFGSAVFYEPSTSEGDLEAIALKYYRYFLGDLWSRFGEEAWMNHWQRVYRRDPSHPPDIVAELRAIADPDVRSAVSLLLETVEAERSRQALAIAFDDAGVKELDIYRLGDGEAMSGLLVAGRRHAGERIFLVLLMD
jgi:hypothetical protein